MNNPLMIQLDKATLRPRLVLFLMIFQTMGVHVFSGIGFMVSIICLSILLITVRFNKSHLILISAITLGAIVFQLCKGTQILAVMNTILHVINASLIVIHYKEHPETFKGDLEAVLFIYALHALISIPFDFILPDSMLWQVKDTNHHYRGTFLYLFYFCDTPFIIPGFSRLNGLAWEPGCLQLLLNIYLLIGISSGKNIKYLIWIIVLIVFTGSTTGYFILLLNMLVLASKYIKKHFALVALGCIAIFAALSPFIVINVMNKLALNYGNLNGSIVVRARDALVGIMAIFEYPLFGIDMSDLANSPVFAKIEYEAISMIPGAEVWYQFHDLNASGYTNGFFAVFMTWGIIGLYFYWLFFRSSAWKLLSPSYRYILPVIYLITLITEPLSNTPFFDFFILYDIVTKYRFSV